MAAQLYIALAIAAASFAAGAAGTWKLQEWRHDSAKLAATQKQSEETAKVARSTFRAQENRDAENLRTGDLLADALLRLRKRPAVRLIETPGACAGASPSALSAPDAEFLVRLAAEADRLRADYAACREWADAVSR